MDPQKKICMVSGCSNPPKNYYFCEECLSRQNYARTFVDRLSVFVDRNKSDKYISIENGTYKGKIITTRPNEIKEPIKKTSIVLRESTIILLKEVQKEFEIKSQSETIAQLLERAIADINKEIQEAHDVKTPTI